MPALPEVPLLVTSWITRRPDRLDDYQAQQLKQILARRPALDRTTEHVRAFAELMNDCRGRELGQWMLPAPPPDRLIGDGHAALEHRLLHLTE
ncbi:hypothetical protein [Streptomyces sp. NBC_00576]|uniref:hypothetical protein n=1 Tax=Streptomyces sp. NBC_00576 TaxID=2903665 RepID=UPI003FCD93C1